MKNSDQLVAFGNFLLGKHGIKAQVSAEDLQAYEKKGTEEVDKTIYIPTDIHLSTFPNEEDIKSQDDLVAKAKADEAANKAAEKEAKKKLKEV